MKKILVFMLLVLSQLAQAQFGGLAQKLKQKAKEAVERQTDKTMDKVVGKGENKVGQKVDEALEGGKQERKKDKDTAAESDKTVETAVPAATFSIHSKFDFIPGEKVVAVEDFSQDAIGDFPAKWNTNASGELVNLDFASQKKWLQFGSVGVFYPEFINDLPENFTLEFDMAISEEMSQMKSGLKIVFPIKTGRTLKYDQHFSNVAQAGADIHPIKQGGTSSLWVNNQDGEELLNNDIAIRWKANASNRVSFWRQKNRLRMYVNDVKVWDIPKAFMPGLTYSLLLATNLMEGNVFISDLKLAYGLPDTRNKLISEGKFSTNGILFGVNSDEIQPSSAGVLKEIAAVLNENSSIKIKIVGHTDADGNDSANMQLSKRRAEAVKAVLSTSYGVATDRMQTDGKGASQPVEKSQSLQGKANNRRVEFIKL